MVNKLYVVMDLVAEESGPVFEARNDGVAIRNFNRLMKDVPKPDDYVLVCVGKIDHSSNEIIADIASPIFDASEVHNE